MRTSRRRLSRRLRVSKVNFVVGWVLIVVALVVTGSYLKAPLIAISFKQLFGNDVRSQTVASAMSPDEAAVSRLTGLAKTDAAQQPLLLTYHQIAPDASDPYTITPQSFATHIDALARAGYHSIRVADLASWMQGASLPPKSVLITFDDGNAGVWQYADPILAQHGFTGVSFVITGRINNGIDYMSWDELQALADTGRWDIEAHTYNAHRYVPTMAHGDPQPALVSRAWLPEQNRQESIAEFQHRIQDDFATSADQLASHGLPPATMFAYPYSATHAGDPEAAAWTTQFIKERFAASMLDDDKGGLTTPAQLADEQLRRIDVLGSDTLAELSEKVAASTPIDPADAVAEEASLVGSWKITSGSCQFVPNGEGGTVSLGPRGWCETALAPTRSTLWSDYQVGARISGLDLGGNTASGIGVRAGSPEQARISVSAGWFTVKAGSGNRVLAEGKLPRASTHVIAASVQRNNMEFSIDGELIKKVVLPAMNTGGVTLYASSEDKAGASTFQGLTITGPGGRISTVMAMTTQIVKAHE